MNRSDYEASLARDGYEEPVEVVLEPDERHDPHTHEFSVRALVLRDELRLSSGGVEQRYGPGDTLDLPRGCDHFEGAGPEGASYLVGRKP